MRNFSERSRVCCNLSERIRCRNRLEFFTGGIIMKNRSLTGKFMPFAIAGAILLGGCGGAYEASNDYATGSGSTASYAVAPQEAAADYEYGYYDDYATEEYEKADMDTPRGGDASAPETVDTSRKLITTCNIDIETKEFDRLLADVDAYVKSAGGYLESINTYNGSRYHGEVVERYANLTVRIPAEKLDDFIAEIGNAGNITNRTQNVQDITLTYVDMEAHERTLREEEERLTEFLRNAETVEDMIYIEDRLSNVRYQIESLESQLRTYDNKINYSTIYLNVSEVIEYTPVVYEEPTVAERMKDGFLDTIDDIKEWCEDFAVWFVSNIIYLIIWAVVIFALVKWILYMASDKRAARKAAKLAQRQQAQYEAYQKSMENLSNAEPVVNKAPAANTSEAQPNTSEAGSDAKENK